MRGFPGIRFFLGDIIFLIRHEKSSIVFADASVYANETSTDVTGCSAFISVIVSAKSLFFWDAGGFGLRAV